MNITVIAILTLIVTLPIFVCLYHRCMNGKYRIVRCPAIYEVHRYYPKYIDGGFDPADAIYEWGWHIIKQCETLEEAKAFLKKDKAEYLAECKKPKSKFKHEIVYRE